MPSHPSDDVDTSEATLTIQVLPSADGAHRLRFHPAGAALPVDAVGSPTQLTRLAAAAIHRFLPAPPERP